MKILSYFVPKILFSGSSPYSRDIKVIEVTGYRKLIVNGTVQSISSEHKGVQNRVWGKLAQIAQTHGPIENLLLLGMGSGTMLKLLYNSNPKMRSTAVEIDPLIVDLTKKYFLTEELPNNRIVTGDAFDVVKSPSEYKLDSRYDVIVIDTYSGNSFPQKLSSDEFYRNVITLLKPGGLLLINRIINKEDKTSLELIKTQLEKFVSNLQVLKVHFPVISDNYLFYGIYIS